MKKEKDGKSVLVSIFFSIYYVFGTFAWIYISIIGLIFLGSFDSALQYVAMVVVAFIDIIVGIYCSINAYKINSKIEKTQELALRNAVLFVLPKLMFTYFAFDDPEMFIDVLKVASFALIIQFLVLRWLFKK